MDRQFEQALTHLKQNEFLPLRGAQGHVVAVFEGELWITQHDDPRDIFLRRGETFRLDRPGPALVHALQPTRLLVLDATEKVPSRSWRRALARALHGAAAALERRREARRPHFALIA